MILEIAAGIVLGFIALAFLRQILAIGVLLAILIGVILVGGVVLVVLFAAIERVPEELLLFMFRALIFAGLMVMAWGALPWRKSKPGTGVNLPGVPSEKAQDDRNFQCAVTFCLLLSLTVAPFMGGGGSEVTGSEKASGASFFGIAVYVCSWIAALILFLRAQTKSAGEAFFRW